MFAALDSFLINKVFQPASDWVTRRSGRSCYWLSWQCAMFYEALFFVTAGLGWRAGLVDVAIVNLGLSVLALLAVFMWHQRCRDAERAARSGRLSLAMTDSASRIHALIFHMVLSSIILGLLLIRLEAWLVPQLAQYTVLVCQFYFLGCRWRPPQRRTETAPHGAIPEGAG
jgi:hypothetical protein